MQDRSRQWRVGFIGTGAISEFHARALRRIPLATLAAVYDTDAERAQTFSGRWGNPVLCSALNAMWQTGVDVVHVLTPPETHASLALNALEHGAHVYVEKPLATSVADCDRIIDAAQRSGLSVGVGHSLLRDPTVTRMFATLSSGAIGEVRGAEYLRSQPARVPASGAASAFLSEGGFPFRDAGIHGIYLIEAILGAVQDVRVHIPSVGQHPSVLCDEWQVLVTCVSGTARLHLSYSIQPWQSVLTVFGSRGILRADLFAGTVTTRRTLPLPGPITRVVNTAREASSLLTQSTRTMLLASVGRLRQFHGVQDAIVDFYQGLRAGREVMATASNARSSVEWTERIAATGDQKAAQFLDRFVTAPRGPVLVTGATGLLGRHLVERLVGQGHTVRVLTRRDLPAPWWHNGQIEPMFGDLGDPAAVNRAVVGTSLVFHLGATLQGSADEFDRGTIDGTRNVIAGVLACGRPRLVYVSSLAVLHSAASQSNQTIDEQWPLEPAAAKRGDYTRTKLAAELLVRDAVTSRALPALILRPGEIVERRGPRLTSGLAHRVGGALVVLGDGELLMPLVAVDDVVDAMIRAAEGGPFDGTVLHLVDPYPVSQNMLLERYLETLANRPRVVHVPRPAVIAAATLVETVARLLRVPAPISRYRIVSALAPKHFVSSRAADVLGWTPRHGVVQALGLNTVDVPGQSAAIETV